MNGEAALPVAAERAARTDGPVTRRSAAGPVGLPDYWLSLRDNTSVEKPFEYRFKWDLR